MVTDDLPVLARLADLIADRHRNRLNGSYTTRLFEGGIARIRQKVGEEAIEVILATDKKEIANETADLLYHLLVLLEASDASFAEALTELRRRFDQAAPPA